MPGYIKHQTKKKSTFYTWLCRDCTAMHYLPDGTRPAEYYVLYPWADKKELFHKWGIWRRTRSHLTFCPSLFESVAPSRLHLKPGEGPIRIEVSLGLPRAKDKETE